MIDSGAGHHIVGRRVLEHVPELVHESCHPLTFNTANGQATTHEQADLRVNELNLDITPHVLEDSPALISLGNLCMKGGFHFVWKPGQRPYLITPYHKVVELEVVGNIPYIRTGRAEHTPRQLRRLDCLLESLRMSPEWAEVQRGGRRRGTSQPLLGVSTGGVGKRPRSSSPTATAEPFSDDDLGTSGVSPDVETHHLCVCESCQNGSYVPLRLIICLRISQRCHVSAMTACAGNFDNRANSWEPSSASSHPGETA